MQSDDTVRSREEKSVAVSTYRLADLVSELEARVNNQAAIADVLRVMDANHAAADATDNEPDNKPDNATDTNEAFEPDYDIVGEQAAVFYVGLVENGRDVRLTLDAFAAGLGLPVRDVVRAIGAANYAETLDAARELRQLASDFAADLDEALVQAAVQQDAASNQAAGT